jgi:hypothetical protein
LASYAEAGDILAAVSYVRRRGERTPIAVLGRNQGFVRKPMKPHHLRFCSAARCARSLLLVFAIVVALAPCPAQQQGSHDAEFRAFYVGFLAAVRANDKNKLGDLIAFPVQDWSVERKGIVETIGIKDKSDFLARYNSLFTPFMRSHVLHAKPQKLSDDRYMVMWQDANAEFSFQFEYVAGRAFRVTAYSIGPR